MLGLVVPPSQQNTAHVYEWNQQSGGHNVGNLLKLEQSVEQI